LKPKTQKDENKITSQSPAYIKEKLFKKVTSVEEDLLPRALPHVKTTPHMQRRNNPGSMGPPVKHQKRRPMMHTAEATKGGL
jgi:hypothetical protein